MKKITLFVCLFAANQLMAQVFEKIEAPLPEIHNSITALGDVDGDGDLDLYIAGVDINNELQGGLYLYGDGTYTMSDIAGIPAVSLGSARWGDIDGDGDLDLALMGYDDASSNAVTDIYLNDGTGVFTNLGATVAPTYMGELALVDFDNDGDLDLAITGMETVSWSFITKFYSNTDGVFSEIMGLNLPGMNFGRIKFADYNNDGFMDFILNGWGGPADSFYAKIYKNNGDGSYTVAPVGLTQVWLGDVEWVDYNDDDNIDLVVSGAGGSGTDRSTTMYKNNGDGSFTALDAGFQGVSHSALEFADFDGDGDLDMLMVGTYDTPGNGGYMNTVYNNLGGDNFTPSGTTNLITSYYGDADVGDIDGDGKIDAVISGYNNDDESASGLFMNVSPDAILPVYEHQFSVYPSLSVDGKINFDFDAANYPKNELTVFSLSGQIVHSQQLTAKGVVDFSNLKSGTYLCLIKTKDGVELHRIILQ